MSFESRGNDSPYHFFLAAKLRAAEAVASRAALFFVPLQMATNEIRRGQVNRQSLLCVGHIAGL